MTPEIALKTSLEAAIKSFTAFDVNCWATSPDSTVDQALQVAGQWGFGGMVLTTPAALSSALASNTSLFRQVKKAEAKGLQVAMIIKPQLPEPLTRSKTRGVRLVRLFPRIHEYGLDSPVVQEVLASCVQEGLPVMISHTQSTWEAFEALLQAWPELTIILEGSDQKLFYHAEKLEGLLGRYPNLLIETHNVVGFGWLERLVARFGAERLLYGTNWPQRNPAASLGMIVLADISAEAKLAIAGGNWRRISEYEPGPATAMTVDLPTDAGWVDAHLHIGELAGAGLPASRAAEILPRLERLGFARFIITHHADLVESPFAGKDELEAVYEATEGRARAFCVFNPNRPEAARECKILLQSPVYVGIKLHPTVHSTPADSQAYEAAFALAAEACVPVMSHTWYRSPYNPPQEMSLPSRFRPHLERYPEVDFVMGHAGAGKDGLTEALELLCDFPNVYADLAGDVYEPGFIEALVAAGGPERVLYASDAPWLDPAPQLACVLTANVPEAALPLLLRDNATRLFRLEGN